MHRPRLAALALFAAALGLHTTAHADAKPFQLPQDKTLLDQQGCLLISADRSEIACIHHELDMGFYDSVVTLYKASGPYQSPTRFAVYNGQSTFEPKGLTEDFKKANAYLAQRGFTRAGVVKPNGHARGFASYTTVEHGDAYFAASGLLPSPDTWSRKERQCCGWVPKATVIFPEAKKAAITFARDCLWTPSWGDAKAACYNKDYCGDECHSGVPDHILILDLKAR